MMIVPKRLSAVGQVAGVAVAALCCYLVSQSVAAERASLLKVDRQIAAAQDDIAKLHMEISVRGRMGQLERWNTEVLALQAPRPSQYVADGLQLAALYGRKGQPALQLDPTIQAQKGAVDTVAYHQPAAQPHVQQAAVPAQDDPAPAEPRPVWRQATFVRPAQSRLASPAADAPPSPPLVEKASFQQLKPVAAVAKAQPAAQPAARKPISLLPSDIGDLAAREGKGGKDSAKAAR